MNVSRDALIRKIVAQTGTPVHIYDAAVFRRQLGLLREHFEHVRFAQKACSNVHVLELLRKEGALVDCVSEGELVRALTAGFSPGGAHAEIVYTADVLTDVLRAVPVPGGH